MAISLTVVAVEKGHSHLLDCLCEKGLGSNVHHVEDPAAAGNSFWNSRPMVSLYSTGLIIEKGTYISIEPLQHVGLDATQCSRCSSICSSSKPHPSLVDTWSIVPNRSRVVCLFKSLNHKLIFLNIDSIFQPINPDIIITGHYDCMLRAGIPCKKR